VTCSKSHGKGEEERCRGAGRMEAGAGFLGEPWSFMDIKNTMRYKTQKQNQIP
jgi:hypothetical protein